MTDYRLTVSPGVPHKVPAAPALPAEVFIVCRGFFVFVFGSLNVLLCAPYGPRVRHFAELASNHIMALPQRPRSLMLHYVGALATIAVLALSSRLCLAWQAPTSPHSSRPCFVGVSSPRRCGSAVPFMGRSRFGATRQSR